MSNFANNIKFLRKKKNLTQAQIAIELGFPRTTWASYEAEQAEPKISEIIRISEYFGIQMSQLLMEELSDDVHLSQNVGEKKSKGNSTPKCTPNSTPNTENNTPKEADLLIFDREKSLIMVVEAKEQVIQTQLSTIELQKHLIETINQEVARIREENERLKRAVPEIPGHVESHSGRGGKQRTA